MIVLLILVLALLSCVKPEIFAAAVGICVVVGIALIALSATGLGIEWQEVTRLVPVLTVK